MKKIIFNFAFVAAFSTGAAAASGDSFLKSVRDNTGSESGFQKQAEGQRARHRDDGRRHHHHGDCRRGDCDNRDRHDGRSDGNRRRVPDPSAVVEVRPNPSSGPLPYENRTRVPGDWARWSGHRGWHHEKPWVWNSRGYWLWSGWAGATVWYSSSQDACRDYYTAYGNSCALACSQTQQECLRDCRIYASDEAACANTCNEHREYCDSGCAGESGERIAACWRR